MSAYVAAEDSPGSYLQQVELATLSPPDCDAKWIKVVEREYNVTPDTAMVTETLQCAGTEDGKSTCHGDSGGPLVCKEGNNWFQYGITSFGMECGSPKYTSFFANVVNLLPWIRKHTGS